MTGEKLAASDNAVNEWWREIPEMRWVKVLNTRRSNLGLHGGRESYQGGSTSIVVGSCREREGRSNLYLEGFNIASCASTRALPPHVRQRV